MNKKPSQQNKRISFAKTQVRIPLPNLIETQKLAYDAFLQRNVPPNERPETGLQAVFKEIFPIRDFSEVNSLEFVSYSLSAPKYTLQECVARGVTYQVSLTARIMLVVREADADADEPHVVDIRESDVYLGEVPLMTENGSFIVNGSERVIVSQLHRSPGVIFLEKSLPTGRSTPTAQIIPYRGAWVEFEIDTKDQIYVRIDKRKKLPATVLLRALGWESDADILKLYAKTERLVLAGWQVTHAEGPAKQLKSGDLLDAADFRQASTDYPDLEVERCYRVTEVTDKNCPLEIGQELTYKDRTNLRRKWKGFETELFRRVVDTHNSGCELIPGQVLTNSEYEGARARYGSKAFTAEQILSQDSQESVGRVCAEDIINQETGEVLLTANTLLTETELERLGEAGVEALTVLDAEDCQHIRFLRNTLERDRQADYEEPYTLKDAALLTIFRTLRPGDPAGLENARKHLSWLLFDAHRYDLGVVGRYKLNRKFQNIPVYGEPPEETLRTLRPEDIAATVDYLLKVHNGIAPKDDLDHLGNRRVRVIGELLENQFRMGLFQIRRTTRERLSTDNDIAKVVPSSLVNPKPLMMALREFFGSNQLSQFMQQINPLDELTHKRRISAIGPGGLHRDRATAAVRDVHRTHYGRVCPLETPEGPSIGLIVSLACYGRINPYGFIETPYHEVRHDRRVIITEVNHLECQLKVDQVVPEAEYLQALEVYGELKAGTRLTKAEFAKWKNLSTKRVWNVTNVRDFKCPLKTGQDLSENEYLKMCQDHPGVKKGDILTKQELERWKGLETEPSWSVSAVFHPECPLKTGGQISDIQRKQLPEDYPGFTANECYRVTSETPARGFEANEYYRVIEGREQADCLEDLDKAPEVEGRVSHEDVENKVKEYFESLSVSGLSTRTNQPIHIGNSPGEIDLVLNSGDGKRIAIAECKTGVEDADYGRRQLFSYLSNENIRFGIFANSLDHSDWIFYENLRHFRFRRIECSQFENEVVDGRYDMLDKLLESKDSMKDLNSIKLVSESKESVPAAVDAYFSPILQQQNWKCEKKEDVEVRINTKPVEKADFVLLGSDGGYIAIVEFRDKSSNKSILFDLLCATDTPFGIIAAGPDPNKWNFYERQGPNLPSEIKKASEFKEKLVSQVRKSASPMKDEKLTRTEWNQQNKTWKDLEGDKFWCVTKIYRNDLPFTVDQELSDTEYEEARQKYPGCPVKKGNILTKAESEEHRKTWKYLETERVWRVTKIFHPKFPSTVGQELSEAKYEEARQKYPGLTADEHYRVTKDTESFAAAERWEVLDDCLGVKADPHSNLTYVDDNVSYLTADSEDTAYIAAKVTRHNGEQTGNGDVAASEHLLPVRSGEDVLSLPMEKVDYIGVSPQQIVGISAALVPFLEHEDANRALMGANHQRQAVPLVRPEAPLVGTGMEAPAALYSGALITAKRAGTVTSVSADEILIYTGETLHHDQGENTFSEMGYDVYKLQTFKRSNSGTCIHQHPIVAVGDIVEAEQVIVDGTSTENGELALGRNVLCAYMPWGGHNYEDSILISETLIKEDTFTSIHIEEFEVEARETKVGPEEITRDIPNVSEQRLTQLDEEGIIRVGSVVGAGSILVGKITPKGESEYGPEEKLLRAIFGEKVKEVRDASTYVRPGVEGVVIDVKVFSRKPDGASRRGSWTPGDSGLSTADNLRYESKRKEIEETWREQIASIRRRKIEETRNTLIGCELADSLYMVNGTKGDANAKPFANAGDILTAGVLDAYVSGFTADAYHLVTEDANSEAFIAEACYRVTDVPELIPTIVVHPSNSSAVQGYLSEVCKPILGSTEPFLQEAEPKESGLQTPPTENADVVLHGYDSSVIAIAVCEESGLQTPPTDEDTENGYHSEHLMEMLAAAGARFCVLVTDGESEPDNWDFYELVDLTSDSPPTQDSEARVADQTVLQPCARSEFEIGVTAQLEATGCPVVETQRLNEEEWANFSQAYPGLQAELFWQIKEVFDPTCPVTEGQELSDTDYLRVSRNYPARPIAAGQRLTADELASLNRTIKDLKADAVWHITAVFDPACTLSVGEHVSDADYQQARKSCSLTFSDIHVPNANAREHIQRVEEMAQGRITTYTEEKERALQQLEMGDELKPGVIKRVKVYVASKRPISVGDKMAGRYGNKGVIAKILPAEDMPYLPDGTPVELVLNPLGVPSRMNVGQILEIHLGWACHELGIRVATPVFDGATEGEIFEMLGKTDLPKRSKQSGKSILFDGRTGDPFAQEVTVGYVYFLKLNHLVADKMHARSTGPYSLVTQQPLGGKAQHGGQRLGEMEVWALEAYGAAHTLQEMLTLKSDDVLGRREIYESVVKGLNPEPPGTPESFKVLVRELQTLGLYVSLDKDEE